MNGLVILVMDSTGSNLPNSEHYLATVCSTDTLKIICKLYINKIMGSTSFSECCNGLVMDCKLCPNRYREACSLSRHDMGLGREGQPRTAKDTTAGCKTVSKILVAWLNFGCCVSCFIFWLVVGTFLCFHILGIILPTDYFFSKELKTPTSICLCRMLNIYTHILLLMLSKVFFYV